MAPLLTLILLAPLVQETVVLDCKDLVESSGVCVAASGDIVWTHNDSGDKALLYGFRLDGTHHATVRLRGVDARDWEDMCSFSVDGRDYIAIGDVGDNLRKRKHVDIWVIEQPRDEQRGEFKVEPLCRIRVTYPKGPVDCEGLAYDARERTFVLATKERFRSELYSVPVRNFDKNQESEAELLGTVFLPMATGIDISRDGSQLALVTYGPACVCSRLSDGKSQFALQQPEWVALPARKQGESICFDVAGENLLATSEGKSPPLLRVAIPGVR